MDGWMNQAYSRLSTTHGQITDCKLLVCMYWTRLVLVRPAASLCTCSASPLKHRDLARTEVNVPYIPTHEAQKNTYMDTIYIVLVSQNPKFQSFFLWPRPVRVTAILRQVRQMTLQWPWTLQEQRDTLYVLPVFPSAKVYSFVALRPSVCKVQGRRKSQMHRMTLDSHWSLNCQIRCPLQPCLKCKIVKIRKCIEWHKDDLEHLSGLSTLNLRRT